MSAYVKYESIKPYAPDPRVALSITVAVTAPTAHLGHPAAAPLPSMREIAQEVCEHYGVTLEALRGSERHKMIVRPRQEAMWRMRQTGRFSLTQIGRFLGNKDHTTVLHGVRRHQERIDADAAIWRALGAAE